MRAEVRARLGIDPDQLVVALIARYHPIKAHAVFLKAAAVCARRLPNVRFLLAGHGVVESNAELVERVRELDLRERVMLLGELDDVTSIYPALDLLVLSSHSEAFPNVLGEAMAFGVPCACTDVGDCARIVGETGRVVSPGRSDLLAGAMVDLLEEPREQRVNRGARARDRIEALFSLESVAHKYEELYRSLVKSSGSNLQL
jgi:glycosyltransferase involved in cell wall biosynthesis